jgi:biotin operon repressor
MKTFEFSIIASGLDPGSEDFESLFYAAGCDDATISFQRGHIIVDFAREAGTFEDAIATAIENVRSAGASVDRVEPDPLVSLSEIAQRTNLTRAAISNYASEQRGKGFPAPVVRITSDSPLYEWRAVATWLHARGTLSREQVIEASIISSANRCLDLEGPVLRARLRNARQDENPIV